MSKILMKGNEAIAESAIRSGCRFFFGYPITPQTEVPEYMSRRLPKMGGCFLQAESEIAAINMVYGAAGTGVRVMTSSSSPGVSLKQEGISYIAASELPCVIINVMRGGPGLGGIQASQGDYFQATKGGGHGDYHLIVLAPASVQEIIDLMPLAFELAEKYRMPAMLLADGILGQMMEPVELPEMVEYTPSRADKPYCAFGWKPGDEGERTIVNCLLIELDEITQLNNRLQARYAIARANEPRAELYNLEGAEFVIAAYGTIARICKAAIDELAAEGINVGLVRPITLWPFPEKQVDEAVMADGVKACLTVELNAGQMVEDVRLAVNGKKPVQFLGHPGSQMPTVEEVKARIREMKREG